MGSNQKVLRHLFDVYPKTVGRIGLYEHCAFVSHGVGQFRLLIGANPAVGSVKQQEFVEEDRVEVLVTERDASVVIGELKKAHPYEEVAFDLYKLEDI